MIPFNKPFLVGKETKYIEDAVATGKISGNGFFTKKCQKFFEKRYGFEKALLTTSCTDALEMAAILLDVGPGDEVIVPSYTFVSSALAFVRQGAQIVFADSREDHPGMEETGLEALINSKTKVIVVVHYAGVATDMDVIMATAQKHGLYVVEDAAQAIDSFYKNRPLGSIGHLGAFSFHETKNIIAGEGGLLTINDTAFLDRSEIIWEKGTNRSAFFKGEIDKYGWVDTGSSFLPSELIAAFLYAQIEHIDKIQNKRKQLWEQYYKGLSPLAKDGRLRLPKIPEYATNNAHMFYIVVKNLSVRNELIDYLKKHGIHSVFHYLSLNDSQYARNHFGKTERLPFADHYSNCLIRLPMYFQLESETIAYIIKKIESFFE